MCKTFIFFFTTFSHAFLQAGRDIPLRLPKIFVNNMQVFNTVIKISRFTSFSDIVTTEVPPLSWANNNLTTEEHEECGKEVCKPNPAHIPAGKMLSFYMHTRLIFVQSRLNFIFRGRGIKLRCRKYV